MAVIGRRAARPADGTMPLIEHLFELRRRLIYALVAVAVGVVLGYVFFHPVFSFITNPYCHLAVVKRQKLPGQGCLTAFGILDPFKIRLRIAVFTGLLFASPFVFYQVWRFVTPGLRRHERRWALSFAVVSVGLFAGGAAVAYFTLSKSLPFLLPIAGGQIRNLVTATNYLSYVNAMVLIFGIAFEFPLLLVMLNLAGVVSAKRLLGWWRPMVFGIFVFAGVATPSQDWFTMTALAVPLVLLFFLSVGMCAVTDRRRARKRAIEDAEIAADLGVDVETLTRPYADID